MKQYFNAGIEAAAKTHAAKEYPNESCGLVVDDFYMPCKNIAENPEEDFEIDPNCYVAAAQKGEILAVVHSHPVEKDEVQKVSKVDMIEQIKSDLPWGIVSIRKSGYAEMYWWGDQLPVQDLIGRPFVYGVYDCYSLVRDFYRTKDIAVESYPRDWQWWLEGEDMLEDCFRKENFYEIHKKELKYGDAIMARYHSPVTNHTGIYLGDGSVLHHLANKLSRRDVINNYTNYITHYLRQKDFHERYH